MKLLPTYCEDSFPSDYDINFIYKECHDWHTMQGIFTYPSSTESYTEMYCKPEFRVTKQ